MKERKRLSEGPEPGSIGERIRGLRTDLGLSLEAFGKLVNENKNSVSLVELGKQEITAEKLKLYARALDTTAYYLLTGNKDHNATVAEDLDLSNDSIEILKESKKTFHGFMERNASDIQKRYHLSLNPIADVINILLKNQKLLIHLHNYFFNDLQELIVKLPAEYDELTADDEVTIPQYELIQAEDIQNFNIMDMEGFARLEIMDELKVIRDSLTEERKG